MSLQSLTINNIVLIEHLRVDFTDGLCALTGETGAGKSILLDSLGLAIGVRAESRLVRTGADKASVAAAFDLYADHPVFAVCAAQDIDFDPSEPLILKRSLTSDGRSRASINGEPVSAKTLKTIGALLVEIHGQHDTQTLLDTATHMTMLDEYAGIGDDLAAVWEAYKHAENALETLRVDLEKSRAEEEFLRAAIEDLDTLAPQAGEETDLARQKERLQHRDKIMEALNTAYYALNSDQDPLRTAWGALDRVLDTLPETGAQAVEALDRATAEAQEALALIQSLSNDMTEGADRLEAVEDRLYALRAAARKFDCTPDELAVTREDLAKQLNQIEHAEDLLIHQQKQRDAAFDAYSKAAHKVRDHRVKAGAKLDKAVMGELEPLKLGSAQFITQLTEKPQDQWGPRGMDAVEFQIATNAGSAPGPLNKIASGGEMSRFMLALKVVMAELGDAQTLVFDEVDAGIGGGTAAAVGERLSALARDKQVLVVTHAPQVAALAKAHLVVSKSEEADQTRTDIRSLPAPERQEELARMLAGATVTDEARAAAKSLLEAA